MKMIEYFERNGGRRIDARENPAEYMLEVIGAGATATTDIDWYGRWKDSPESQCTEEELGRIHDEGRSRRAIEGAFYPSPCFQNLTHLVYSYVSIRLCYGMGVPGYNAVETQCRVLLARPSVYPSKNGLQRLLGIVHWIHVLGCG